MHADEVVATADQVAALVAEQFPHWSGLHVTPVAEFGTDHCLFRVGDDLVARMPRVAGVAAQAESDARWLPVLAPHLPVAVPSPVALGEPGRGYPWRWSLAPWLPGSTPAERVDANAPLAADLAAFVRALRGVPTSGGPAKGPGMRGAPLHHIDDAVRQAIGACGDRIDASAVTRAWDDAVSAPDWDGPPVWIHGDLMVGNLLVDDSRLSAVIDFGSLGLGDPAPDLLPYWCVLAANARSEFRAAVGYDDDTWRRGRGWAIGPAITGIPYYWDTVPEFARRGQRTLEVVLADED